MCQERGHDRSGVIPRLWVRDRSQRESSALGDRLRASGTPLCLRALRPASFWAAIDGLGVTTRCGAHPVCSVIANVVGAPPLEHPLRITTAGAPPLPTIIGRLERLERLERLGDTVAHVHGLTEADGPFPIC
jgi:fatty-acyl-CoA synthase